MSTRFCRFRLSCPGRRADIAAFFNADVMHSSVSPVGNCFGRMRQDDDRVGASFLRQATRFYSSTEKSSPPSAASTR